MSSGPGNWRELNPNHPTTKSVTGSWHVIAALLVHKAGGHAVITQDDLLAGASNRLFITVQELDDGLHLKLVDEATADELVKEHGGA